LNGSGSGSEERELFIEKLVAGGDGLAFLDGKAVFVPGVLPGETVSARLVETRRDFDRAALVEVLKPSPGRAAPPCALAGICGGCDWLHISYEEQRRQKAAIVREALRRVGGIDWDEVSVEPGPPLGYRNRVQIHRDSRGTLGFKGLGSARIVHVAFCPVADPGINRIFRGETEAPADGERFTVYSAGGVAAREGIDDDIDIRVRVAGKEIVFSVGCFFQSNLVLLEKLVPFVMEGLDGTRAADLYCGVGLFGAFLAERFSSVTAVESSATSAAYARRNLPEAVCAVYPMMVEHWTASGGAGGPFDAVIVDPPRAGLGVEVRQWICRAMPQRLRYVSCNPVTLARDLRDFVSRGFLVDDLRVFDFYPQTSHIECVARLRSPQGAP
jgi:23S rRNA (uracil1939-C5)-methyltransferase